MPNNALLLNYEEWRALRLGRTPLLAVAGALAYPFLLAIFHRAVCPAGGRIGIAEVAVAVIALVGATLVPVLGLWAACGPGLPLRSRRLAYMTVIAPTLYVFLGVSQGLPGIPIPDTVSWCLIWGAVTLAAALFPGDEQSAVVRANLAPWRMVHGVTAALLCVYVLFHIANHVASLSGPVAHAAIMDAGRVVYRNRFVEPVLVASMLFQVATGLLLAWRWSAVRHDFYRTFQIASGIYLAVFIVGHMNSVFIYARTVQKIPTNWTFATGTAAGLVHDAWNIRLVPHYTLGVFFVLAHLLSGARVVLLAHGGAQAAVNRAWIGGVFLCGVLAVAILSGMCGVRI